MSTLPISISAHSKHRRYDSEVPDRRGSKPAAAYGIVNNPFIARLEVKGRLDPYASEALAGICADPIKVAAKTTLVAQGTSCEFLHILLDGWACRFKSLADGRRQITALLLAGDICDLDNLYIHKSDQLVTTLTSCTIARVERSRLRAVMEQSARLREMLGWLAALDNALLSEHSTSLGQRPARERIAHLLCELATRMAAIGACDGRKCHVPLTQEQIGDALGLTAVHVNRVLQVLRAENIVEKRRDRLTILNWDALAEIAAFSPTYLHIGEVPISPDERFARPSAKVVRADSTSAGSASADTDDDAAERNELRHRFKNFVAIALSLVNQTLREDTSLHEARERLNRRLAAMGGAMDVLASGKWQKGGLHDTVEEALKISGSANRRITSSGPDLQLNERAVMGLTMALHELQTNALKYGSLSSSAGSVDLFWKLIDSSTGSRLWMQWVERDGPVAHPPEQQGFGTRLITSATARALGGEVEIDHAPTGLTWILVAPLARISAA
jgi:two-component sensor histidine kinase/CRP-like cAMP-binding protein